MALSYLAYYPEFPLTVPKNHYIPKQYLWTWINLPIREILSLVNIRQNFFIDF
jgi:hypothetical protein